MLLSGREIPFPKLHPSWLGNNKQQSTFGVPRCHQVLCTVVLISNILTLECKTFQISLSRSLELIIHIFFLPKVNSFNMHEHSHEIKVFIFIK